MLLSAITGMLMSWGNKALAMAERTRPWTRPWNGALLFRDALRLSGVPSNNSVSAINRTTTGGPHAKPLTSAFYAGSLKLVGW